MTEERTIRIALLDVCHETRGLHAFQMPIGIGMVAAYADKMVTAANTEFRLYRSAHEFLREFRDWKPDIVGGAFFCWNRNLNLSVMRKVKQALPDALTVLGGPEVDKDPEPLRAFLMEHREIDIAVLGQGEKPFVDIINNVITGTPITDVEEVRGAFWLKADGETLVKNLPVENFSTLDDVPSPYTNGMFDKFFDANLHPMIQTSRGCPFGCTFCNMALKMYSNVKFVSPERIRADVEYCAERLKGRHDIILDLCDSNFGMYPQVIPIVKEVRRVQDNYDWPRYVSVSLGKNKKENIIAASHILKWGLPAAMSAQSLNQPTLEAIQRDNISLDAMRDMLENVKQVDENSYSDLIMNLPMETKESFEAGLDEMINTGVKRLIIMTLYLLHGTPMADQESIDKYGFDLKYRIIPRAFGEYEGEKIVESEALVVATNTMSRDDYLSLRELQLVVNAVYNSGLFNPTRRLLDEFGANAFRWLKRIYEFSRESETGKVREHMDVYAKEARDELFESVADMQAYVEDPEEYKTLLSGERGDNLMNKYQLLALSDGFAEWQTASSEMAFLEARETGSLPDWAETAFDDIRRFQALKFDFAPYFDEPPEPNQRTRMRFDFDIQAWLADTSVTLEDCRGETFYDVWFDDRKVELMQQFMKSGHEISQTKMFIYREHKYEAFMPNIDKAADGGGGGLELAYAGAGSRTTARGNHDPRFRVR